MKCLQRTVTRSSVTFSESVQAVTSECLLTVPRRCARNDYRCWMRIYDFTDGGLNSNHFRFDIANKNEAAIQENVQGWEQMSLLQSIVNSKRCFCICPNHYISHARVLPFGLRFGTTEYEGQGGARVKAHFMHFGEAPNNAIQQKLPRIYILAFEETRNTLRLWSVMLTHNVNILHCSSMIKYFCSS